MSATTYQNNPSSKSFKRQNFQTKSNSNFSSSNRNEKIVPTMTNDGRSFPSRKSSNPVENSLIGTCLSNGVDSSSKFSSSNRSNINETMTRKNFKQTYTFSNPPRELQRQSIQNMKYLRHNRLRQRVSSAPDENSFQNSPRSILNQQKPLSANESSTPRSRDETTLPSASSVTNFLKRDEKQKRSFNVLMKEQEKSKVPKAVQQRRIILLFRRLPGSTPPLISPRQQQNSSPIRIDLSSIDDNFNSQTSQTKLSEEIPNPSKQSTSPAFDRTKNDVFNGIEQAELADSKQIAAILANMQSSDDWIPVSPTDELSPRQDRRTFDPTKYEYVTKSSLDTATFRLSPRTLKPDEEIAAKSRFSQYYRYEMLSSVNAQIPPLMASVVAENGSNVGLSTTNETTFTFRLNSTSNMKKQTTLDEIEPTTSTVESEEVQLCFDEILKCFYDPNTGTYYELTST